MLHDVFLSHSHADRDWTRALFNRLSATDYDGRPLRAWLDARVLDPGNLSSARELESALDRSRCLLIVLSPEAVASTWVNHEITYFARTAGVDRVILLQLRACDRPPGLAGCRCIDWRGAPDEGPPYETLCRWLRPSADPMRCYTRGKAVRRAFGEARVALGDGFDPRRSEEGDALLALMLEPRIQDLDEEGEAMTGFLAAAQALSELDDGEGYMMRLLLGEILAEAQLRHPLYAQVPAAYVRSMDHVSFLTVRNRALMGRRSRPSTAHLPFAVARAASKLAEIDPSRVDPSTLAALLQVLDRRTALDGPGQSVAAMVGRTLGKVRGSPLTDALLHALAAWGGDASHIAVAAAVSCSFDDRDPPVYTTREVRERAARASGARAVPAPLPRIARLLMDPLQPLGLNLNIEGVIRNARADHDRAFGAWDPGAPGWSALQYAPPVTELVGGPLAGWARRVTRTNMEAQAGQLGPTDIAVLTEPRIVDALFDGTGGFLIHAQDVNAPLGVRLRARGVRWAACSADTMAGIEDGTAIVWWNSGSTHTVGYAVAPR